MALKQKPFTPYHEEKKIDSFTVRLNAQERELFEKLKYVIQQEKDSTAIKQLALGITNVILDEKIKGILSIVLNNYRRNKRLGIVDFD